ncbi:DUF7010 family protein [Deinococcus hopiensis]|uniref:DUF7010 family protein n=1 Tax=Deinococcus hopiensis TaxID=309885 RepID=UPI000A038D67|nr:hypothetical protein [Deinococcus hopiensis]
MIISLFITVWGTARFRSRRREFSGVRDSAEGKRVRKGFIVVNAVQWSSIGTAVLLLALTDHSAWITPCVILITGLHFFPLAQLFRYRGYNLTAAALVVVAVLAMLFGDSRGALLSLLATGTTLWASAVALLSVI